MKNNKKGFTLFEILTVVAIIAVLGVSSIISFNKTINNSNINKYNDLKNEILSAAKVYIETNESKMLSLNYEGATKVTVGELQESTLINWNLKNPVTKENISSQDYINAYKNYKGELEYEYIPEDYNYKVYGVEFNLIDGTAIRTDDAQGKTYTIGTSEISSDFDNAEIYKEMSEVVDVYGNKFIRIPKFYIKKTVSADKTIWKYQVSKEKKDELYYLPACFYDEELNKELPYILVGKYNASLSSDGSKLESKSGKGPATGKTIIQFRNLSKANGNEYQILDIHIVDALQTLFYIEFGTLDAQSIMAGYTATSNTAAVSSGNTDLIFPSGSANSITNGLNSMKYRGIENLYSNVWQFIDGINVQDRIAYVAKNAKSYASDLFSGAYTQVGYTMGITTNFALKMGYDLNSPYANLPIESTSTYSDSKYKDYYFQDIGNRVVMYGGSWNMGTSSGASCWALTPATSSFPDVGTRLVKAPL